MCLFAFEKKAREWCKNCTYFRVSYTPKEFENKMHRNENVWTQHTTAIFEHTATPQHQWLSWVFATQERNNERNTLETYSQQRLSADLHLLFDIEKMFVVK